MPDYSRINGRKIVGDGYTVIEAIKEYGMTACADVICGHTADMADSTKGMNSELRRPLEFETSGKITKAAKPAKGKEKHLSSEKFDAFQKPGLRQNRLLYIVDRIPALSRFENPEAIYVAFPEDWYIAKSNFLFMSPCYKIKNIYYIKTKRFEWDWNGKVPTEKLLEPKQILEELVEQNRIKRTIDQQKAEKS
jgi:hypothetical protein